MKSIITFAYLIQNNFEVVAFDRNRKWLLSLSHQKSINACVARTPVTELGQNSFTTFTDLAKKKMDNEKKTTRQRNDEEGRNRWKRRIQKIEEKITDFGSTSLAVSS